MKPYYSEPGIEIYHGDCRDILPALDVRSCAIVTDPPCGLGERWQGGTWGAAPMYADARRWDSEPFPAADMTSLLALSSQAIVWCGNYYALPASRCWLAWIKSSQMATMADFELAWTSLDRPAKQWTGDRNPDGKRQHPTQKPLALMQWCLGFVEAGSLVLDPFAGSGTTIRAAKDLGRRAIGIESEERYCAEIVKRLRQEMLFRAVSPGSAP